MQVLVPYKSTGAGQKEEEVDEAGGTGAEEKRRVDESIGGEAGNGAEDNNIAKESGAAESVGTEESVRADEGALYEGSESERPKSYL